VDVAQFFKQRARTLKIERRIGRLSSRQIIASEVVGLQLHQFYGRQAEILGKLVIKTRIILVDMAEFMGADRDNGHPLVVKTLQGVAEKIETKTNSSVGPGDFCLRLGKGILSLMVVKECKARIDFELLCQARQRPPQIMVEIAV